MSIYYPTSITYNLGQEFAFSQNQGSLYLGMAYTEPLSFTPTLSVTEPINPAVLTQTVANYPTKTAPFFMGSFDGFWIHKIYLDGNLIGTVQTVNQEFFTPLFHDRVESVSMGVMNREPCADCHPHVPAPSALLAVGLGVAILKKRFKNAK